MKRLENKIAFITGGAGGIGMACAERFIAEGAKVIIADLFADAAKKGAERLGPDAFGIGVDIGDESSVKDGIAAAIAHFGRIDILFNNAALTSPGVMGLDSDVVNVPMDVWNSTLHVNLTGTMLCCRYAIPHMADNGGGTILNTASGAGLAADVARVAYGVSKAGMIALTKYVATQHGHEGIRANAICPGPVVTPLSLELTGDMMAFVRRQMPLGKLGAPKDIAALASFLVADESEYINGEIIAIDGGTMAHHAHVPDMQEYFRSQVEA